MNDSDKPRKHSDPPTLDEHPGLDNDEATEAGKMMTASGSLGPAVDHDPHAEPGEWEEHAAKQREDSRNQREDAST